MAPDVLLDVLERGLVRRRVDELGARHHGGGLRQPGGEPERLHLALHLIARAGPAVVAVEGRRLQEETSHHEGSSIRSRAPRASTRKRAPRQSTARTKNDAKKTENEST